MQFNGDDDPELTGWRARLHRIIFGSDTPAGRTFDVALIIAILLSTIAVLLDSVESYRARYGAVLRALEWTFTILFSIEYVLRLVSVRKPGAYARSFFGIVDLLAILPTYLSLLVPGAQYLLVIRTLRILRVFRVLKLVQYMQEMETLTDALRASRRKILVFLFAVLAIVLIVGALMYLIEGPAHGFTSIPVAVYWAIVTLTTVGYGDVTPGTDVGRTIAACLMILGYGIIAVPTGIVTAELTFARTSRRAPTGRACPGCGATGHDGDAEHCKHCGTKL